jgi:hypothetical protein
MAGKLILLLVLTSIRKVSGQVFRRSYASMLIIFFTAGASWAKILPQGNNGIRLQSSEEQHMIPFFFSFLFLLVF